MIRDWTSSAKINQLTPEGERFFVRLTMKADDFGNYPESLKLLNGNLFPDHTTISDTDISIWLSECVLIGVIERYVVDGKKYLHIPNFGQRLDRAKPKYPPPAETIPEIAGKLPGKSQAELELELERELELKREAIAALCAVVCEIFGRQFQQPQDRMAGMANWYSVIELECDRILKVYSADDAIRQVKAYIKYCRDQKRKMIGTNFKVSETILSSDWMKLLAPMGGTGSGIDLTQNRKVYAG